MLDHTVKLALLKCMTNTAVVPLATGLWGINDIAKLPGGAKLPLRATVIDLGSGDLAIHSPVAMSQEAVAAIGSLGVVRYVIAPSGLHHLHAGAALKAFPSSELLASRALARKRKDLHISAFLDDGIPTAFGGVLEAITLAGAPKVQETVFFHKPSGALLVTDLLFNVTNPEGFLSKVTLSCTGTNGRLAQSRLWHMFAKDKPALVATTRRMLDWRFDMLVPCHGDVVASGARQAVEFALRFK